MWSVLRQALVKTGESAFVTAKNRERVAVMTSWSKMQHLKNKENKERGAIVQRIKRMIDIAVTVEGNANPSQNIRLAQAIATAKKNGIADTTIKAHLERAKTLKGEFTRFDYRGPGGSMIIIDVFTDNPTQLKMLMASVCKKYKIKPGDLSSRAAFIHKGMVLTERKGTLDEATEAAITAGAEEVEEVEDEGEKLFQFTCDPQHLPKVANQLSKTLKLVQVEEVFEPNDIAYLTDEECRTIETFYTKLEIFPEINKIHDNIEPAST